MTHFFRLSRLRVDREAVSEPRHPASREWRHLDAIATPAELAQHHPQEAL